MKKLMVVLLLAVAVPVRSQVIADHTVVAKYDSIPGRWIDSVKCMLLLLPGESHGRGYHYGLEDLAAADSTYACNVTWGSTPETYTSGYLRSSRGWRDGTRWSGGAGEADFYTNAAGRADVMTGLSYTRSTYRGKIAFGFGWCWDMSWHNSPGGTADPVYGCRWAGSSVGGPDGDVRWGIDKGDTALTGNAVTLETYLDAVAAYNAHEPGITTFYTTGPVDGLGGSENGYQRWLKHEAMRDSVRKNGGYLFDYADILCWEDGAEYTVSWYNTNLGRTETFQTGDPDLASGGTGYQGSQGSGCHITQEGCEALAKAMWWFMARIAGWDGSTAGDTVAATPVISPAGGTYEESVEVSVSCATAGASVYYTTDGTDPDTSDTEYSGPFTLVADAEIRARAYRDTLIPSAVASVSFTVVADTTGPAVVNAYANSSTGIVIEFSEPLDSITANTITNYGVDNGISVTAAQLRNDDASVELTVAPAFGDGIIYAVTVNGVQDVHGNAVESGTGTTFGYNACTAYWSLDDAAGDTARDGSGYGNHLVLRGAEWTEDGSRGGALAFDGNDTAVVENVTFGIDTTGAFTVSFRFKCTETGGAMAVLGAYYRPFGMFFSGDNVRTCIRTGGTNYATGDSLIVPGRWYHCALTFGEGTRTAYVNGGVDHTAALDGDADISYGQTFWLGQGFNGVIDEVRIYNRALTQGEVAALTDDGGLPVGLSSFTVTPTDTGMQLDWVTQSETGNLGWHVYRRQPGESVFNRITDTMVPGNGTTAVVSAYRYLDRTTGKVPGRYEYYLEQYDCDMSVWRSTTEGADLAVTTVTGERERGAAPAGHPPAAAPCPFAGSVVIYCPENGAVLITDHAGRAVRSLRTVTGRAVWDGADDAGKPAGNGVYYAVTPGGSIRLVRMR